MRRGCVTNYDAKPMSDFVDGMLKYVLNEKQCKFRINVLTPASTRSTSDASPIIPIEFLE